MGTSELCETIYQPFICEATKQRKKEKTDLDVIIAEYDYMELLGKKSAKTKDKINELSIIRYIIKSSNTLGDESLNFFNHYISYSELLQINDHNDTIALDINLRQVLNSLESRQNAEKITVANGELSETNACDECKERYQEVLHGAIPFSYAIFGATMFALTCIFGVFIAISCTTGYNVMNPWYALISFLCSLALLITDISACLEWRKILNGQSK